MEKYIIEYIVSNYVMESQLEDTNADLVLSAESLYDLPMDILAYIANMDIKAYIRMYLLFVEFRKYAAKDEEFKKQIVVERMYCIIQYEIGNIMLHYWDYAFGRDIAYIPNTKRTFGSVIWYKEIVNIYDERIWRITDWNDIVYKV